jgi:hypothetical protein
MDITSMPHARARHHLLRIIDHIQKSVVADPHPPAVSTAPDALRATWTGGVNQLQNVDIDARQDRRGQGLQIAPRG